MTQMFVEFFSSFPPLLATFLMSLTPFGELRLSIPVGILGYGLPIERVFLISVIGNMIPPTIILLMAPKFQKWIEKKSGYFAKGWVNYLASVQKKFQGRYARYGLIALIFFVGIPLPMTGAWSGSVAAFIFGLPPKKAWPYILIGVVISGVITTMVSLGVGIIF